MTRSEPDTSAHERTGRPRDPEVDRRVQEAAMDIFAARGWGSFSIDAVARLAGVGKASIYLRWPSKEALLTDAVADALTPIAAIDSGDVRDDLLQLAELLLGLYEGRHGLAARRMTLESQATPGIAKHWERVRKSQVAASRAIVRRAVDRGQLPPSASVTLILDTLCGAAINRSTATPSHLRRRAEARRDAYAADLVDFVIGAARAAQP